MSFIVQAQGISKTFAAPAGGREFHYIPALNDNPDWIRALVSLVQQHLQGWPAA